MTSDCIAAYPACMFNIGPEIKSTGRAELHPHDHGKIVTFGTVQCCHCDCIIHIQPGSKRRVKRGFCSRCKTNRNPGMTCGRDICNQCNGGAERLIENMEAGMVWADAMLVAPIFVPFNDF